MASTDVQQPVSLEPSDHSALDGILRHHLTLEPPPITGQSQKHYCTILDLASWLQYYPLNLILAGDSDQLADSNKVTLQTQSSTSPGYKASRQV